ncbi:MAG TPA: 4Fe-4S binding protein [bacterium]|nr:4Fe-4S binding protein [bacterium]HPN30990.1 4Fe-4S binding protein [bacterium]
MKKNGKYYPLILFNLIFIGVIFFSSLSSSIRLNINKTNVSEYKQKYFSQGKIMPEKINYFILKKILIIASIKIFFGAAYIIWIFRLLKTNKINFASRLFLYAFSLSLFGIITGSYPNPLELLKNFTLDILFYKTFDIYVFFMLASFFFPMFFLNGSVCGWVCPFGVFQDLIYRINRNINEKPIAFQQFKMTFKISNYFRFFFFIVIISGIVIFNLDIIAAVNPFLIFNPILLWSGSAFFSALILISSLFIYRPFCFLFCPFGLASWFAERFSINKIRVNKNKCSSCGKCVDFCPSGTMESILTNQKTKPDCYLCGTCVENCPDKAISIS